MSEKNLTKFFLNYIILSLISKKINLYYQKWFYMKTINISYFKA